MNTPRQLTLYNLYEQHSGNHHYSFQDLLTTLARFSKTFAEVSLPFLRDGEVLAKRTDRGNTGQFNVWCTMHSMSGSYPLALVNEARLGPNGKPYCHKEIKFITVEHRFITDDIAPFDIESDVTVNTGEWKPSTYNHPHEYELTHHKSLVKGDKIAIYRVYSNDKVIAMFVGKVNPSNNNAWYTVCKIDVRYRYPKTFMDKIKRMFGRPFNYGYETTQWDTDTVKLITIMADSTIDSNSKRIRTGLLNTIMSSSVGVTENMCG